MSAYLAGSIFLPADGRHSRVHRVSSAKRFSLSETATRVTSNFYRRENPLSEHTWTTADFINGWKFSMEGTRWKDRGTLYNGKRESRSYGNRWLIFSGASLYASLTIKRKFCYSAKIASSICKFVLSRRSLSVIKSVAKINKRLRDKLCRDVTVYSFDWRRF